MPAATVLEKVEEVSGITFWQNCKADSFAHFITHGLVAVILWRDPHPRSVALARHPPHRR